MLQQRLQPCGQTNEPAACIRGDISYMYINPLCLQAQVCCKRPLRPCATADRSAGSNFSTAYACRKTFARLGQPRCIQSSAPTHMARDPNEAPDPNFAEALQADASLGSFGELLRQVVEDSPALSGDASSDEAPGFSNTSRYSGSAHSPQGFHGPADVEQLAQHAQQEAARFQLSERERRERNKAAQAAYRQRKRVSLICH